jgi:hypothetical protein
MQHVQKVSQISNRIIVKCLLEQSASTCHISPTLLCSFWSKPTYYTHSLLWALELSGGQTGSGEIKMEEVMAQSKLNWVAGCQFNGI